MDEIPEKSPISSQSEQIPSVSSDDMTMTVAERPSSFAARHLVTVEEFGRMVEAGVFDPEAKLELVEGEIFEMPAMHSPHASTASKLLFQFSPERLRMRAVLRADYPILCGDHSQPRPDIALARWPYDRYDQRHPGPEDLLLVVEVADSSARFDRHEKVPLYGAHGIPEAWLVDVQRRTVEVYTQPGPTGHGRKETYKAGDTIAPQALSDVSMGVADLFPKSG